ncbi:iduronate 2-sulfatase-like isoform X2 [Homarus americanus]|uniref:iduronate 2-sulfatase-like isoform X2 n=1 Tax=Homarus americanus TaxID=6706 RepID=UPI001C45285C|nr:iduronate 2-sulfatase-like isoform X2 [Homarus americanus]
MTNFGRWDVFRMRQLVLAIVLFVVNSVFGGFGHPNVLLIVVDDLRPALGCYGDSLALTPNIDSLALHGTILTRAFAQQALCGPSRTSFLTSRRPDTTRLYDVHFYWREHAGNFTTLPQYFKEHGYHTVSAGKIFHPGIVSNHSDDQPYSWSEAAYHPPTQAHKQDPVCMGSDGQLHTNIYCPVQVEKQPGGSLPDIETTEFATVWLKRWAAQEKARPDKGSKQPFFLAVGYHKPHIPLKFPWQFLDAYPIGSIPLAPNSRYPHGLPSVAWNPWNDLRYREDIAALNVSFPYGPLPDYYARYIRQGYYAAITYTDALIGDLLSTVTSLFPDTLIALIGDHGWSLGEHQEWSKFSNFEVATRVPFIVTKWSSQKDNVFQGYNDILRNFYTFKKYSFKKNWSSSLQNKISLEDTVKNNIYKTKPNKKRKLEVKPKRNSWTRIHANKTFNSYEGLVELVDLFPTLVDLAGLPALSSCPEESKDVRVCTQGSSLAPILNLLWDDDVSIASEGNDLKRLLKKQKTSRTNRITSHIPYDIQVKKAVFSQYPRPGPEPTLHPDSDQPPMRDTTIMGYSMRTNRYRYTAWLNFNNITFKPDWSHVVAEELYDHFVDDQEDHNICRKKAYRFIKQQLQKKIRKGLQFASHLVH